MSAMALTEPDREHRRRSASWPRNAWVRPVAALPRKLKTFMPGYDAGSTFTHRLAYRPNSDFRACIIRVRLAATEAKMPI
jgi:hypothetical protein